MACWLCMGTMLSLMSIPEHARNKNGSVAPNYFDSDTLATHIHLKNRWSDDNQVEV